MNWLENLQRSFLDFQSMREVLPIMITVGLKNTLILAAASTVLGIVIGMVLAVMGISRSPWLRVPARVYTDVFRGLPAIVTILLIGQGFSTLGRQIFGPSPYPLGILALSLNLSVRDPAAQIRPQRRMFDRDRARANRLEQRTIVGHQEQRAGERGQRILERLA